MENGRAVQVMARHGLAVMLIGLFGGFVLMTAMLGGISLSPLPVFIPAAIGGTTRGWAVFDVGSVMNGIMALSLSAFLSRVAPSKSATAIICWGTVLAVWGNCLFYLFAMWAPNHGLSAGANRLGEGSFAGMIAFYPALIGAIGLLAAVVLLLFSKAR